MPIENMILKNIKSINEYSESSGKYLDDGPAKYDTIIKLLALQKEYQQKINELNQLNYNFNQGIPMDQIKSYQRKGILMSLDGSKRTCVNNSGVCTSNNPESKIKFLDFINPSIRDDMGIFGSAATSNKMLPFYTKDAMECSSMCQDDEKCGMWVYADFDAAINSVNRELESGTKYNDVNKALIENPEMNNGLAKHGGGVLGWMRMIFAKTPIDEDLGEIKKGTQIVKGNCFNIPTDKVGKNITCSRSNAEIGKTMMDFGKINKGLEKNFGISKSVLTPETINYSSGYCEDTIKRAQKQLLEKSAKNFAPVRAKMLKNKDEYIQMRNEKEKELLYLSIQMKSLLDTRSSAMETARMNVESSKNQVEKIGKKQDEIDANIASFNNSVMEYQEDLVKDKVRKQEALSGTFVYTFWLTLFVCFAVLIMKPDLLSKPVSYTLMGMFSLYVLHKLYQPLMSMLATIYKTLRKILWSNNNI